jgi:hypothetical protein
VPAEFVDWLADKPEHEAYPLFYGREDSELARQWRIEQARRMAHECRVYVQRSEATRREISVKVYPSYISPTQDRKDGGGYVRFEPTNSNHTAEFRHQASAALQSWINRYECVLNDHQRGVAKNLILELADDDSVDTAQINVCGGQLLKEVFVPPYTPNQSPRLVSLHHAD